MVRALSALLLAVGLLQAMTAQGAPQLPGFRTLEGKEVLPANLHGKVTVVALFSVTCPFCMNEAPKLEKLYRENRAVLDVVAVSVDRSGARESARKWTRKYGLTHHVTTDFGRFEAVLGSPKGIPTLYLFDQAGNLVRTEIGELLDEDYEDIARFARTQKTVAAPAPHAVPLADDLRRDARAAKRSNTPLILFFTLPNCAYCHTVRQQYLAPLFRGSEGQRYIVREIVIDGGRKVIGFDGIRSTHRDLARRLEARIGPTVMFVDDAGGMLAPPLYGGDIAGMYGAYLEDRLALAQGRIGKPAR